MVRPCFLVIDREYSGSISTRKLVIETAKFNVITAYSSNEAIETLKAFLSITGVVLDAGITDMPCTELVKALKRIKPNIPVVAVGIPRVQHCELADHFLQSFDPAPLLELLKTLIPEQAEAIQRHNDQLASTDS
jgi:DNA-binding NtrC family response regulator